MALAANVVPNTEIARLDHHEKKNTHWAFRRISAATIGFRKYWDKDWQCNLQCQGVDDLMLHVTHFINLISYFSFGLLLFIFIYMCDSRIGFG